MNDTRQPRSHIDYVLAAVASLISLLIIFSVPFPVSLLPVIGIFAVTGYVALPALKKRQQQAFEEQSIVPERFGP